MQNDSTTSDRACTVDVPLGSLVLLSGPPAAGKTSLKRKAQGFADLQSAWLSMDDLRVQLLGASMAIDEQGAFFEDAPQTANAEVFSMLQLAVRARLRNGRTCIVDGTWLAEGDRLEWLRIAQESGATGFMVLELQTTDAECIEANAKRDRRVSEGVMRAMLDSRRALHKDLANKVPAYPLRTISRETVLQHKLPFLRGEKWDVIGDVHGLLGDLQALLTSAGWKVDGLRLSHPDPARKLLFLGDLVDRGPDSLGVLRLVRAAMLDGLALCVRGNHEEKLLRFCSVVEKKKLEGWSSLANAETGMALMRARDRDTLIRFLRSLPTHHLMWTGDGHRFVFAHANLTRFSLGLTNREAFLYGDQTKRGVDTDALYEEGVRRGLNQWTLVRGHIPQTSAQPHVISLEDHAVQKGRLLLLRMDSLLSALRSGASAANALQDSLFEQHCSSDYEAQKSKWRLAREVTSLKARGLVREERDESTLLGVYTFSKRVFWDNLWSEHPALLKTRGLVLDASGAIASHPFDKCFNYLENGTGADLLDSAPVVAVEKLNGFLGVCSLHPVTGDLLLHTKGKFNSPFVDFLREYALAPAVRGALLTFLHKHKGKISLMFEVVHPDDPHIIEYGPQMHGLHLIGVRGLGQNDQPWSEAWVDAAAQEMGLRRPRWHRMSFGQVRNEAATSELEGFVVREDSEEQKVLLKIKTPFYLTTKFLGRLSANKAKHMFSSPASFKQTMDEEFTPIVDALVARFFAAEDFLGLQEAERMNVVRELVLEQRASAAS